MNRFKITKDISYECDSKPCLYDKATDIYYPCINNENSQFLYFHDFLHGIMYILGRKSNGMLDLDHLYKETTIWQEVK